MSEGNGSGPPTRPKEQAKVLYWARIPILVGFILSVLGFLPIVFGTPQGANFGMMVFAGILLLGPAMFLLLGPAWSMLPKIVDAQSVGKIILPTIVGATIPMAVLVWICFGLSEWNSTLNGQPNQDRQGLLWVGFLAVVAILSVTAVATLRLRKLPPQG